MSQDSSRIAFIGWGQMGGPMGRRLLAAGYPLAAFDLNAAALEDARAHGATLASTPADAARGADVVITMLPHDRAVAAAAHDSEGILAGLAPGALWLEMSSSYPRLTRQLAEEATGVGVELLDAPVTGGVPRAISGELTVIAAGPEATFERARPLLDELAAHVFRVGPVPGMGDLVKTVNNLLSAANLCLAAEGMAMIREAGVEPALAIDVLNSGTGQSNATSWKIPQYVLTERFDSRFSMGQYLKDLDIAMRVATEMRLDLPLSVAALQRWRQLAEGALDVDHTAVVSMVGASARSGRESGAEPAGRQP